MSWVNQYKSVFALTIWREARGEGHEGMRAVAHVIANRSAKQKTDVSAICTAPWQFSSMTAPGDPMLIQWPKTGDAQFEDAMIIVETIYENADADPTGGATMYANLAVCKPKWDFSKLVHTVKIGAHDFWKEK